MKYQNWKLIFQNSERTLSFAWQRIKLQVTRSWLQHFKTPHGIRQFKAQCEAGSARASDVKYLEYGRVRNYVITVQNMSFWILYSNGCVIFTTRTIYLLHYHTLYDLTLSY